MKKVIGITGKSGSGKSEATAILKSVSAYIVDADVVARDIVKKGERAYNEIVEAFGETILTENGEINRKKLGATVFADEKKLSVLNTITHKYIIEKIKCSIADKKDGLIIIDAPLLFDTGLDKLCDKTIVVTADESVRIKRIMLRDGLTEQNAKNRLTSQKDDALLCELADCRVENNGDKEELKTKIKKLIKEIV